MKGNSNVQIAIVIISTSCQILAIYCFFKSYFRVFITIPLNVGAGDYVEASLCIMCQYLALCYSVVSRISVKAKLQSLVSFHALQSREIEELRSSHDKRIERLHCLQRNYKLIKKQLAMVEEECHG